MKFKNVIKFLVFICLIGVIYFYHNDISNYIFENFVINKNVKIKSPNNYYKNYDYAYVQLTDNFSPKNKQDLINIFYTILNNGWSSFSFYCDSKYEECYNDLKYLIYEEDTLSYINDMVNPYNSYENIFFEPSNFGKFTISVAKLYNDNEINYINNEIDKITNSIITDDMTTEEKIKVFHDYIINLVQYDKEYDVNDKNSVSNKANGALLNKKAVCSGYSDLMAIFLDRLGINNYKIISKEHVWNLVYINGKWLHLDLTWDDPTTSNGKPILIYDFFLITTEELENISKTLKDNQHVYNKNVYLEAN
ncbi:MAG: hypothetical protein NC181_01595 [Clostridium sp.]|nr:hypothetical protein [Clostridium sp.]MCM1444468.1 hypothetical protein [Candidatus Amulumruptor caecigallinarius]